MIVFEIPGALRPFAEGRSRVEIPAGALTVGAALAALWRIQPGLRARILTEQGAVRCHVNVFVGNESIRDIGGLDAPVPDGATIMILPAVSGGRG